MSNETLSGIDSEADQILRRAVERIVRPIVATEGRKLKMRRELYAHAVEAYTEEVKREADGIAAADRAARRLGDPSELTTELQGSVSMTNRREARLDRWFRRDSATPPLRHAAWVAMGTGVVFFVFMLTVVGLCEIFDLGKGADQIAMQFTVVLSTWFGTGVGIASWFGGRIRDALGSHGLTARSLLEVASLAVAGFLVLLTIGFGVLAILFIGNHGWSAPLVAMAELPARFHLSWTALCAVIAVAAVPIAWLDIRERSGLEDWLNLELD